MKDRSIPAVLLAVILIVSVVPPVVAAQSVPRTVLLDQDTTQVGTISVDGQTYQVYHHDNLVPWASGIEVYTEGDRVTSESTAQRVLTALAQRRAVDDLGPDDVEVLRTSAANVNATASNVSEATVAIDDTLAYLMASKNVSADGSTEYNESVEAAPTIVEFNESARELEPQLRSFENDSAAYSNNATRLARLIEQRENGRSVDPQVLYARYSATLDAMDRLSDHVDFSGINEPLRTTETQSEAIAANVSSVPDRGDELAQRFRTVHNTSSVAANGTDALELPESDLEDAQDTAQSLQSDWMDQWETRGSAAMDVYKTIAGLVVAILLVGGYIWWRRR